jgi:histidinol phosphatase-like PHP family hydrolase
MRYVVDHDYHIHSQLSECSSHPEQTTANILKYAKNNGLKKICLTDHFWDDLVGSPSPWYAPQDFAHICEALPLPKDDEVEFVFGCESDFDKIFRVGVSKERLDKFDFIVIPTTHLHMRRNGFFFASFGASPEVPEEAGVP